MTDTKNEAAGGASTSDAGLGGTTPLAMAVRCRDKNYKGEWLPWRLCALQLWHGEEAAQRALEDWPADEKELVRLYGLVPNAEVTSRPSSGD